MKYNFALLQQLSGIITSEVLASNQIAPNITLPRFEVKGGFVNGMSGIMTAMFVPLIAASLRGEWEEYSVENQGWLEESARLKMEHEKHLRPLEGTHQDHETDLVDAATMDIPIDEIIDSIADIPNEIWRWEGDEKVPLENTPKDQLLAPLWQNSPAEASTINVDLFSDTRIADLYESMLETNQTVMSSATQIGNLFDWMFYSDEKYHEEEPHAFLMEPVFANFSSEQSEPIGFVMGLTSFRHLFEDILPPGADGIYCVLTGSSACGTNITYLINGPEAIFIGYHDLHEGLDEYEASIQLELYDTITENLCVHDLHIYPSPGLEELHQTSKAA